MKKNAFLLWALLAGMLASVGSAEAQTTRRTVSFEEDCAGAATPGTFSVLGYKVVPRDLYRPCGIATITTGGSVGQLQLHSPETVPLFPPTLDGIDGKVALAGAYRGDLSFAFGDVTFEFSPAVNELAFDLLSIENSGGITITLKTASGDTIAVPQQPVAVDGEAHFSQTSATPIASVTIAYAANLIDGWFIDAVEYNAWRCGDGEVEQGEACDDGNAVQCDGCRNDCTVAVAGCLAGTTCIADGADVPGSAGCATCEVPAVRPATEVLPTPAPIAKLCDDGLYCKVSETCNGLGQCVGSNRNCNDALSCTVDTCNEATDACDHDIAVGCLIDGTCFGNGEVDANNPCLACNRASSTTAFSDKAVGARCGDPSCSGGMFTAMPTCAAGAVCVIPAPVSCAGAVCADPISCTGTCTNDSQCLNDHHCLAGSCVPDVDNGDSCTRNDMCTSGYCIDGVCCDGACGGACKACNLAGSEGVCTPFQDGTDPFSECPEGQFCGSGMCVGQDLPDGDTCTSDAFCASGHCVDGVCCTAACDRSCEACNLPGSVGTCTPHATGSDPESDCPGEQVCAAPGICVIDDQPDGTDCELNAGCTSGHCVDGVCCAAACDRSCEACNVVGSVGVCTPHAVGSDPEGDCGDAQFCAAPGVCVNEDRPNGNTCDRDAVCKSGHCADGVCCNSACNGTCESCNDDTPGVCAPFAAGEDPENECDGEAVCGGNGQCLSYETRGNGLCTLDVGQKRDTAWLLALLGLIGLALSVRRSGRKA